MTRERERGERDRGGDRDRDRERRRGRSRGRRHRSRSRSPPRRRDAGKADDQQRLREMLLMEAAKKNPDAAQVLQSSATDQEALQRALATASTLSVSQHQQMQQQMQAQQAQMRQQQQYHHHQQQQHGAGRPQQNRIPDHEKVFLELHVGNLPEQMTDESELTRFLNDAALKRGLNIQPGNPVISSRINSTGRFAFSLFRSKEEATKALELSGTQCFGNTLRVDRPRGYKELYGGGPQKPAAAPAPNAQQVDDSQVLSQLFANVPIPIIPGLSRADLKARLEASIAQYGDATSLVQLSNMQGATVDDVEVEAKKHGNVSGVKPSPTVDGAFLVKMASIADAEKLVQLKRAYRGSRVEAVFRPLSEWTALQG